jgi:hypothetical protein
MRHLWKPLIAVIVLGTATTVGVYAAWLPLLEFSVEQSCPPVAPDRSCLRRMRGLGDGWSLAGNLVRARPWYERAAAAGDVVAMFELGWMYEQVAHEQLIQINAMRSQKRSPYPPELPELSGGVTKLDPALAPGWDRAAFAAATANGEQAASWYRRAADQGFAPAMNNLGSLYDAGLAGRTDMAAALQWYRAAAATGIPAGLWNVGAAYDIGEGVRRGEIEAETYKTWHPNPDSATDPALDEPVLQRTALFQSTMSAARRAQLRAAIKAGTPMTVTIYASPSG